ncbi:MAG: hypothetical protein KIT31_42635, partial [Deltaproteobacteria bacterium]|nr:hypothetical protein [Deltaproteobacteria bacterium]
MSRFAGLLVFLVGATALAEPESTPPADTRPPAVAAPARTPQPLRLVRVTPDSSAALIFDKSKNRNVLVSVGDLIGGYMVDAIEDDAVIL